MNEGRRGFLYGASAYLLWGLFPLYWPLVEPAGALEILAHRIVWSLVTVAFLVLLMHRMPMVRAVLADRRRTAYVAVGAIVIAVNWGGFIYGVNNGHVVEVSLGYFINPLITILLGVVVLGERLRPVQVLALGLALVAVVELSIDYGRVPVLALVVAFSFGTYGLMKKKAALGAVEGLGLESLFLTPVALGYLLWLEAAGTATFGHQGWAQGVLLAGAGLVTAVPLLLFGAAATRVSLTTIGLLQYLTPTIQFVLGVVVFDEQMTTARWVGFALVWTALAVITTEAVVNRRRTLRESADSLV